MSIKRLDYKSLTKLMSFSVLCLIVFILSVGIASGQKKPKSVPLDPNTDDKRLCLQESLVNSKVCELYALYEANKDTGGAGEIIARNARNDMIDLVVGQVDSYFKLRKDGRRTKIRFYETILDFLRIGGELAVTIINGERAKTIIGATLAGLDTGRTKYDKNFEVLQTQILINKMITKRANTLIKIINAKNKPVRAANPSDAYSWEEAKNHLRDYLLAGTFDDALDALVQTSGSEAQNAQNALAALTVSKKDVVDARTANDILAALNTSLNGTATQIAEATTTLRNVVIKLSKNANITPLLAANVPPINSSSTGRQILDALIAIRGTLALTQKSSLIIEINQAVIDTN